MIDVGVYVVGGFLRGEGDSAPVYEGLPPYPYFNGTPNTTDPHDAGVMESVYLTMVSGTGVSGDYTGLVFDENVFKVIEIPEKSSNAVTYQNVKYSKVRLQPDGSFVVIPGTGTTVYHVDPSTWSVTSVVKPSAVSGSYVYDYYRGDHAIWCTDAGFFVWDVANATIIASDTSGPCYTGFEQPYATYNHPYIYAIGTTLKIGHNDGSGGVTVVASYADSYNVAYVIYVAGYVYWGTDYVFMRYASWDDANATLGSVTTVNGGSGITYIDGSIYTFTLSAYERTFWAVGYDRAYTLGSTSYTDMGNYMVGLDIVYPLDCYVGWRLYAGGYLLNYDWKNGVVVFIPDVFSDVIAFTYDAGISNLSYQHTNESVYDLSTGSVSASYDVIGVNGLPKGVVIAYNGI